MPNSSPHGIRHPAPSTRYGPVAVECSPGDDFPPWAGRSPRGGRRRWLAALPPVDTLGGGARLVGRSGNRLGVPSTATRDPRPANRDRDRHQLRHWTSCPPPRHLRDAPRPVGLDGLADHAPRLLLHLGLQGSPFFCRARHSLELSTNSAE